MHEDEEFARTLAMLDEEPKTKMVTLWHYNVGLLTVCVYYDVGLLIVCACVCVCVRVHVDKRWLVRSCCSPP